MGKAIYEKASNLTRARMILEGLDKLNSYEHAISRNDYLKISQIEKHLAHFGSITPRQFRALSHYGRVYQIKILQPLDFILD